VRTGLVLVALPVLLATFPATAEPARAVVAPPPPERTEPSRPIEPSEPRPNGLSPVAQLEQRRQGRRFITIGIPMFLAGAAVGGAGAAIVTHKPDVDDGRTGNAFAPFGLGMVITGVLAGVIGVVLILDGAERVASAGASFSGGELRSRSNAIGSPMGWRF
jgi:hypothetical protein